MSLPVLGLIAAVLIFQLPILIIYWATRFISAGLVQIKNYYYYYHYYYYCCCCCCCWLNQDSMHWMVEKWKIMFLTFLASVRKQDHLVFTRIKKNIYPQKLMPLRQYQTHPYMLRIYWDFGPSNKIHYMCFKLILVSNMIVNLKKIYTWDTLIGRMQNDIVHPSRVSFSHNDQLFGPFGRCLSFMWNWPFLWNPTKTEWK